MELVTKAGGRVGCSSRPTKRSQEVALLGRRSEGREDIALHVQRRAGSALSTYMVQLV